MNILTVRRLLRAALASVLLSLGALVTAQAAIVTGRYDPAFGAALPGVGYQGIATFTIADACLGLALPPSGSFISSSSSCGGGGSGMTFIGADVTFFDLSNPSVVLGTVHFGADPDAVLGMFVQDNQVIGVQSVAIGPATSTLPYDPAFFLQFGILNPPTDDDDYPPHGSHGHGSYDSYGGHGHDDGVDLDELPASAFQTATMFVDAGGCTPNGKPGGCATSNSATVRFVSEPGSTALVLGAFIAAGLTMRRRQQGTSAR